MPQHQPTPVGDRDLFDLARAREARDEAMQKTTDHNPTWSEQALERLPRIPFSPLTGEEIRRILTADIGPPAHHNAWGAIIRTAVARGVLKPTGQHRQMTSRKSHARQTPVYELAK